MVCLLCSPSQSVSIGRSAPPSTPERPSGTGPQEAYLRGVRFRACVIPSPNALFPWGGEVAKKDRTRDRQGERERTRTER